MSDTVIVRNVMNDKQIELVARALCEIRDIDPDASVSHGYDPKPGDTFIPAILLHSPAWTRLAIEIRQYDQIQCALDWVANTVELQ